jgi:hypothetical protein
MDSATSEMNKCVFKLLVLCCLVLNVWNSSSAQPVSSAPRLALADVLFFDGNILTGERLLTQDAVGLCLSSVYES